MEQAEQGTGEGMRQSRAPGKAEDWSHCAGSAEGQREQERESVLLLATCSHTAAASHWALRSLFLGQLERVSISCN